MEKKPFGYKQQQQQQQNQQQQQQQQQHKEGTGTEATIIGITQNSITTTTAITTTTTAITTTTTATTKNPTTKISLLTKKLAESQQEIKQETQQQQQPKQQQPKQQQQHQNENQKQQKIQNQEKSKQQQQQQQQQQQLKDEQPKTHTTTQTTTQPPTIKQRNKLKRWVVRQGSIEQNDLIDTTTTAIIPSTTTITPLTTTTTISTTTTTIDENSPSCSWAMGGGGGSSLIPSQFALTTTIATISTPTTTTATAATTSTTKNFFSRKYETTQQKEQRKEKTEKFKLSKKDAQKQQQQQQQQQTTLSTTTTTAATTSTSTTSRFAEKLRRSFRRSEHKSLETKKAEKFFQQQQQRNISPTLPIQQFNNQQQQLFSSQQPSGGGGGCGGGFFGFIRGNNNNSTTTTSSKTTTTTTIATTTTTTAAPRYSQQSLLSLNSLANSGSYNGGVGGAVGGFSGFSGIGGGGHINPALLLDSPDEATPPDFDYYHLSSVATTNSSASFESNFDDYNNPTATATTTTNEQRFFTWPQEQQHYQQQQQQQQANFQKSLNCGFDDFFDFTTDDGNNHHHADDDDGDIDDDINKLIETRRNRNFDLEMPTTIITTASTTTPIPSPIPIPTPTPTSTTSTSIAHHHQQQQQPKKLQSQSSSKSDNQPPNHANLSPSCSLTSNSYSGRAANSTTNLKNKIFKSSNESHSSYLGHSNEGFTASSQNSSSGEWENITAVSFRSASNEFETINPNDLNGFLQATNQELRFSTLPTSTSSSSGTTTTTTTTTIGNNYYQYTLPSPNNPFLPEITTYTYYNNYDDEPEEDFDSNITSVKYKSGSGPSGVVAATSQLTTTTTTTTRHDDVSRANSQESTHSDSGLIGIEIKSPSSTSSTPGRQRRRLFRLHSPTRHLLHQQSSQHHHQHQHQQQSQHNQLKSSASVSNIEMSPTAATYNTNTNAINANLKSSSNTSTTTTSTSMTSVMPSSCSAAAGNLIRYLNPFLPLGSPLSSPSTSAFAAAAAAAERGCSSSSTSPIPQKSSTKRAPLRQSANVTSPIAVPTDLNARREEFLRATMKICLVVSPPLIKTQMKSKSLTHLDGIDSRRRSNSSANAALNNRVKSNTDEASLYDIDVDVSEQQYQLQQRRQQSRLHHQQLRLHQQQQQQHQQELTRSPSSFFLNVSSDSNCSSFSPITTSASFTTGDVVGAASGSIGGGVGVGGSIGVGIGNSAIGGTLSSLNLAAAAAAVSTKKKTSFLQRKKPFLPRSEASSSEYFSIIYNEKGNMVEEVIPAIRGITLSTALYQFMTKRNWSFSDISMTLDGHPTANFLETGNTPIGKTIDENTDTESLIGRHVLILEKNEDGSVKHPLKKALSFNTPNRPARLLSSASADENSELTSSGGKQFRQRWSGIFGVKTPSQAQFNELLNSYNRNGIPQRFIHPIRFQHPNLEAAMYYINNMHHLWKDFVKGHKNMTEGEVIMQTALWEIVTTEISYIHSLQMVTNVFQSCLEAVQEQNFLTDIDVFRVFGNSRELLESNIRFWTVHVYPMVSHSIATGEPMRLSSCYEGFLNFKIIFDPYTYYCAEQSAMQFYCKEHIRNNPLFPTYIAWCEKQEGCKRSRFLDILVRPMQRITKYGLLLSAFKRFTHIEENTDVLDEVIRRVQTFVTAINNHLTIRQEEERLKGVMARIESYEIVPTTNNEVTEKIIKQFGCYLDLCSYMKYVKPPQMRYLFMEGDHKLKDHLGKLDVHCFLFTDILLVCKNVAKKGLGTVKVIRQPYFTDRLLVHQINNVLHCVYVNEFNLAITAFSLQCAEATNWFETMKRARNIYKKLKSASSANSESYENVNLFTTNYFNTTATGTSTTTINTIASNMSGGGGVGGGSGSVGGIGGGGGTVSSIGSFGPSMDTLSIKKSSPINSAHCSHVSSANNSHSGSVEFYDSRNISVDCAKTNSFSSDDGSSGLGKNNKNPNKSKVTTTTTANTLSVQPTNNLVQSLPNLNLHANQNNNLYHTYSNNTLLVPGTRHSRNLLSPNFHNISYPPPSPTRTQQLRRVSAVPNKINPPLVKTRNITSQNSINWHQIPATPTPPTPQFQQNTADGENSSSTGSFSASASASASGGGSGSGGGGGSGGSGYVDGIESGCGGIENETLKAASNNSFFGASLQSPIQTPQHSPIYFFMDTEQFEPNTITAAPTTTTTTDEPTTAETTTAVQESTELTTDSSQRLQQQHSFQHSNETDV